MPPPDPPSAAPPVAPPTKDQKYTVQNQDHISAIARAHGYLSWETLWKRNKKLAGLRSNPSMLYKSASAGFESDELTLPGIKESHFNRLTKKKHEFKVTTDQLFLRIRILNQDFTPMRGTWRLQVNAKTYQGKLDPFGQLEQRVVRSAVNARLEVTPADSAGGSVPGGTPPVLTFDLLIGSLNPMMDKLIPDDGVSGVQQRLSNLSFPCGRIDGIEGPATANAVRHFQRTFGLKETGKAADIKAHLQSVHDQPNSAVKIKAADQISVKGKKAPPVPPRPGADGPVVKKTGINTALTPYRAFIAPDHPSRIHFNTLVVRPDYRISLHFYPQDMDLLFPRGSDDPQGRIPRLHALTYFPLIPGRKPGDTSLTGEPDPYDELGTEAICWREFCRNYSNHPPAMLASPQSEEKLRELLGKDILEGGKLPSHPALGKIFLPGGYAITDKLLENVFNTGTHSPAGAKESLRHTLEKIHRERVPALGMIPIVARVESQYPGRTEWEPVEGAVVYFQLVQPDETADAGAEAMSAHQKQYVDKVVEDHKGADEDPQRYNAPKEFGGKRGHPVAGPNRDKNIFLADVELEGFHKPHATLGKDFKDSRPALGDRENYATASPTTEYDNAARATTNAQGEAGIIFMPSFCGGDRYRLRAFVGPPTLEVTEEELKVGKKPHITETGTMIVWRVARVSRVLAPPSSSSIAGNSRVLKPEHTGGGKSDLQFSQVNFSGAGPRKCRIKITSAPPGAAEDKFKFSSDGGATYGPEIAIDAMEWQDLGLGINVLFRSSSGHRLRDEWSFTVNPRAHLDPMTVGPTSILYKEFHKGYTVVKFDCANQRTLSSPEWQAAHAAARSWFIANPGTYPVNPSIFIPPQVDPARREFAQTLTAEEYNAAISDPTDIPLPNPLDQAARESLRSLSEAMLERLLLHFTLRTAPGGQKGFLPGITIIRALRPFLDQDYGILLFGQMRFANGCYMFYNNNEQREGMPHERNPMEIVASHEAAHSWNLRHQHTDNEGESNYWQSLQDILPLHEQMFDTLSQIVPAPPSTKDSSSSGIHVDRVCLMSYHVQGQCLCGKCLLAVRGWNVAAIP